VALRFDDARSLGFGLDAYESPCGSTSCVPPLNADPEEDELAEEGTPERRSQQADINIRCDEARRGRRWPEAERRLLIEQRIRDQEDLDRWVEALVELHRLQLSVAFQDRELATARPRELVDTVERGNVVAKVAAVAMAHPFLAELIGASLIGKLRKRRGDASGLRRAPQVA